MYMKKPSFSTFSHILSLEIYIHLYDRMHILHCVEYLIGRQFEESTVFHRLWIFCTIIHYRYTYT